MDKPERKAAIATFKERKAAHGVYAVICTATGEAWVGCSRHVDNHRNGLLFALRLGTGRNAGLQASWKQHGEQAFKFEELERLRDDFPEFSRSNELKKRQAIWLSRLKASPL